MVNWWLSSPANNPAGPRGTTHGSTCRCPQQGPVHTPAVDLPPPSLSTTLQGHAADTYAEFAAQNKEPMQAIPPPLVALNYYKSGDL